MIDPAQIRAARALLGWSQHQLALAAGLSRPSIDNFEHERFQPRPRTIKAILAALNHAGVEFTGHHVGLKIWADIPQTADRYDLEASR
jgi:transcriptional regulator with XRE-family HTH domain